MNSQMEKLKKQTGMTEKQLFAAIEYIYQNGHDKNLIERFSCCSRKDCKYCEGTGWKYEDKEPTSEMFDLWIRYKTENNL